MKRRTVVLVDDHEVVRAGIRATLGEKGVAIVGETGDGLDAVRLVSETSPDIVLLDLSLRGLSGFEVARRITQYAPATKIVILTMHAEEHYVLHALRVGVSGYVLKEAAVAELALALEAVMRGDVYLSVKVSSVLANYIRGTVEESTGEVPLTPIQKEVLRLLASGLSTKEIAARMGRSAKTIESHRQILRKRLGIGDLAGLVRYAVRTGLIPED